jgi:hypothetical protein
LIALAPYDLPVQEKVWAMFGWIAVWTVLSRFHPQRQFLHDALAGTRLVASPPLSR